MRNTDKIAIRIVADEYRLDDTEALEHIMAIVSRGDEDALSQISGILAESGRGPDAAGDDLPDDLPDGYDPDSGEFGDFDEGDLAIDEGMEELSLIDACLNDILKPNRSA